MDKNRILKSDEDMSNLSKLEISYICESTSNKKMNGWSNCLSVSYIGKNRWALIDDMGTLDRTKSEIVYMQQLPI